MKRTLLRFLLALLFTAPGSAQSVPDDLKAAVREVQKYDFTQPRAPLFRLDGYAAQVTADATRQKEFAALLAAAIVDPSCTPLAKTIFCQMLALAGTDAEVPLLGRLLDDPQLSDSARLALDGIRGPASAAALRSALARLSGRPLVGVIHSLGDRRDAEATASLIRLLAQQDREVSAAAALALAAIASKDAAQALAASDHVDAQLRCARNLIGAGESVPGISLCKPLLAPGQPANLRAAALSILSRAQTPDARSLLLGALGDADDLVAATAIRLSAGVKDPAATEALVGQLKNSNPARRVLILSALAGRGDGTAAPAVAAEVDHSDETVGVAAITTLGAVGDQRDLELLSRIATTGKGPRKVAAEEAMAAMKGEAVDAAIAAGIASGPADIRRAMMSAASARNLVAAVPALLSAATDADESVRTTAAQTLGKIGRAGDYAALVNLMTGSPSPATREVLCTAVSAVGRRIDDPQARLAPLLAAAQQQGATPETIVSVLRALGGIGGSNALAVVRGKLAATDPSVREAAVRALADWPDGSALEDLAALVNTSADSVHKALALRGLLRLAPLEDSRGVRWLHAMRASLKSEDEKRQMLGALGTVRNAEAMQLAVEMLGQAGVKAEAALASAQVGRALVKQNPAAVLEAMERVLAAVPDSAEAKAVLAQARAAMGVKSQHSQARREALARGLPATGKLVAYLDCGVERIDRGPQNGVSLQLTNGQDYDWSGGGADEHPAAATVAFAGGHVGFTASNLDPARAYELGFTWWDFDGNGREESVWVSGKPLVGRTVLPVWKGKQQGPATLTRAIPAAAVRDGRIDIEFKQEGAGNCVVSELWLIETSGPATAPTAAAQAPKRALIVTGLEYPGHKWRETAPFLRDVISEDGRMAVTIHEDAKAALESPTLTNHDVIVLNYMNWENPGPGDAAQENLRKAVDGGAGLVLVHFACGAFQTWPEFVKIAGRVWNPKFRGHDPRGPFQVNIVDARHEITKGFAAFGTDDELYTCLDGTTPVHILADAKSKVDQKDYPMAFVLQYGKGRVFLSTLGHDVKALSFPDVKNLYRRATAWAAGLPPES